MNMYIHILQQICSDNALKNLQKHAKVKVTANFYGDCLFSEPAQKYNEIRFPYIVQSKHFIQLYINHILAYFLLVLYIIILILSNKRSYA